MRYTTVGFLALCLTVASAFKDTSPYVLLSTTELPSTLKDSLSRQLQTSENVRDSTSSFLESCPSDTYVIVSQRGINADDFSKSRAIPHLRKAMLNERLATRASISEVSGEIDPEQLMEYIVSKCHAIALYLDPSSIIESPLKSDHKPLVLRTAFDPLPSTASERVTQLAENDYLLQTILEALPTKYTVIYTTTPPIDGLVHKTPSYEPVFIEPLHMELKRQSASIASVSNEMAQDRRPLFEKYQFFTPGLFMAFLVSLILMAILSVAISAVSSLQVSYGAFDKEMGPVAHKKQQ